MSVHSSGPQDISTVPPQPCVSPLSQDSHQYHFLGEEEPSPRLSDAKPSSIRRKPVGQSHVIHSSEAKQENHLLTRDVDSSNDGSTTSPTKSKRRGFLATLRIWRWELASLAIALCTLIAMVIVLRVYQNKSVSHWKLPISVNAIIAILSALFKGSLALPLSEGISQLKWLWFSDRSRSLTDMDLFDRASRGPWGSVLLIFKQFVNRNRSYLASLGAFICLLAIATDPFSQATVSLASCMRNSTEPTFIPRVNSYTNWQSHAGPFDNTIDKDLQLAVYMGIIQPPTDSSTTVHVPCRTGNCTYADVDGVSFSTAAMCHSCDDLTEFIKTEKSRRGLPVTKIAKNGVNLTISTSNIFQTMTLAYDKTRTSFKEGDWIRTSVADIAGLGMVNKDTTCDPKGTISCDVRPMAFKCGLRPCVKTYKASYKNGEYHEQEVSRKIMHYVTPKWKFELALDRTFYNGTWRECKPTANKTDVNVNQVAMPDSQKFTNPATPYSAFGTMWYPPECVYLFGGFSSQGLEKFIGDTFDQANLTFTASITDIEGPVWLQAMWNLGNMTMDSLNAYMNGVALTISAEMRQRPDAEEPLTSEKGQSLQLETCIEVRWRYLSFLAILMFLELAFIAGVIAFNHRSTWGADWKSSPLALIFQASVHPDVTHKEDDTDPDERSLYATAQNIRATFVKVDGKWKLCKD